MYIILRQYILYVLSDKAILTKDIYKNIVMTDTSCHDEDHDQMNYLVIVMSNCESCDLSLYLIFSIYNLTTSLITYRYCKRIVLYYQSMYDIYI